MIAFARYAIAVRQKEERDFVYRVYVTDCLRQIGENVAPIAHGKYLTGRWMDLVKSAPEDNRTGREIADDVIKRAGLVVKKHGPI